MQHAIRPLKNPIQCKLTLPGSKCMTQRALMLAALSDGVSEISNIRITKGVRTFLNALHQLGIVTQLDDKTLSCIIAGGNGQFPKKQATVWCASTKIITRFLLAACAATSGVFYFDGASPLRKKHIGHILSVLSHQGAQLIPNDTHKLPFTLIGSGSLVGGEITLDDAVNSQILSALLMIAPFARSPFNFNITELANRPSINMTCALMAEYGVLVHRIHQGQFMVPVPQRYQAKDLVMEPDFSIGAYFFAAAAVSSSEITIQPVKPMQSKQPDAKCLSLFASMGCHIQEAYTGLTISGPEQLQGIEVSLSTFSDTFYALAATALFAKSPTRITHLGTPSKKEMDRLMAIKIEFTKLGAHVESGANWFKIFPSKLTSSHVSSHQDPRLVMALAIIGLKIPGIVIDNAEAVNQVYPDFFRLWDKLSERRNISA